MAELKGLVGGHISVVTSKGDEFQTDTYFPANPADVDQSDHTALLHLSDATLLHNTRMRYLRDDIYTYVGPILVSVNPFKYTVVVVVAFKHSSYTRPSPTYACLPWLLYLQVHPQALRTRAHGRLQALRSRSPAAASAHLLNGGGSIHAGR